MTATVCTACERPTPPSMLVPCDTCDRLVCPDQDCREEWDGLVYCASCASGDGLPDRAPELTDDEWGVVQERIAYVAECNVI